MPLSEEDLALARACLEGDATALSSLETMLVTEVRRAVSPLDSTPHFIDEVTQLVREKLLVHKRLANFSGGGALAGWLRTVAVRVALNARRSAGKEELVSQLPDAPLADPDPELALLRARHREAFRAAFAEAVKVLSPRDRTILRLTSIDGLSLAAVGQMYGKDASTVSRWLAASRDVLLQKTRATLAQQLQLSDSALDSVMRAADSELHLSIARLLQSSTP
ncbi:MAG: sigma-70 family RNA polymerase sigma factor [Archangium sp.]|nr:sigma-70 family RNA polymerase sigma factor [Archangium sp.]